MQVAADLESHLEISSHPVLVANVICCGHCLYLSLLFEKLWRPENEKIKKKNYSKKKKKNFVRKIISSNITMDIVEQK